MRGLRTNTYASVVLGLIGTLFLGGLSGCGGASITREVANVEPIVVLTAEGGGVDGADLGGVTDGNVNSGGEEGFLIVHYPCNLKAQVFMPAGSELEDGTDITGDAIAQAGKITFEVSDDEGESWFAVQSDVVINGNGSAYYHSFDGVEGCPDLFLLRASFEPAQQNRPKRGNGSLLDPSNSEAHQTFRLSTMESPFVDAYITVPGDFDPDRDGLTRYPLSLETGQPASIPGTRALASEDEGGPLVFPISFTINLRLRGIHNYTLLGKSHISDENGEESEENFAIPMNVNTCDENGQLFTHTFTGFSPIGNGPILTQLRIGGSFWEIGDPHAAKPGPTSPTPNQRPVAQLDGEWTGEGTFGDLDAGGSSDPDGSIVQYSWDFTNDGTIDQVTNTPTVTHDYGADGDYTARVVVTDNQGATATAIDTFHIGAIIL